MSLRPRQRPSAVDIVEAAYMSAPSIAAWLERVVDIGRPVLESDVGIIATVTKRTEAHITVEAYAESANPFTWLRGMFESACREIPARHFEPYYGPGEPVRTLDDVQRTIRANGHEIDVGGAFVEHGGLSDLLLIVTHPVRDTVLCIAALDRGPKTMPRLDRRRLTQVALHLENAARLHLVPTHELAVITTDGRIADLDSARTTSADIARLESRVRLVERIRTRRERADATDALDAWPALVNGTYSLVEHIDSDGLRFYRAYENPVAAQRHRALSPRERSVLELTARGLSGKWTAYSLGLSESSVSEALSAAACKLGISSRTRLAAIAAELVRGNAARDTGVAFTAAEHEVLAMVARGMSNDAIARARGRSIRTIANQVAALLRKSGAGSRRSLAALAGRAERTPLGETTNPTA